MDVCDDVIVVKNATCLPQCEDDVVLNGQPLPEPQDVEGLKKVKTVSSGGT